MEPAPLPVVSNLLKFGRALRRVGIEVHPGRLLDLIEALRHVNIAERSEVYYACRALLVHRHEQLETFDRAFERFWATGDEDRLTQAPRTEPRARVEFHEVLTLPNLEDGAGSDANGFAPDGDVDLPTWSDLALLADKDFAAFTPAETAEAAAALARLTWSPGERRTRRWIPGRGPRIDLRRAISDSLRTQGDVVALKRRARHVRPRPLILLCDVSRSMERYTRMLLHFAHAVIDRRRRVEAFVFSTRLTRITRELRVGRSDRALAAVSRAVPDWSGGTRIGAAMREFHQHWGRRVMSGGPVVLVISDGWDCGDPAELSAEIARLQRSCHRLVWLSPLIGTADYAPLTRGLQAALPFVDDFLPVRTLTNLADLAVHLNALA
jgi:uncharacterized protein with von Willebrand factor type A (vWA) domain